VARDRQSKGGELSPPSRVFCDHLQDFIPTEKAIPFRDKFIHVGYLEDWADENRTHLGLPYRTEAKRYWYDRLAVFNGEDYSEASVRELQRKPHHLFNEWCLSSRPIEPVVAYTLHPDALLQDMLILRAGLGFFLLPHNNDIIKVLMP